MVLTAMIPRRARMVPTDQPQSLIGVIRKEVASLINRFGSPARTINPPIPPALSIIWP